LDVNIHTGSDGEVRKENAVVMDWSFIQMSTKTWDGRS